jgi:hypothetical protein
MVKGAHYLLYSNKKTLYGFKQLDAEYLIYRRSVVKTSYDRESVLEWLLRSPDDGLQMHGKLP